MRNLFKELEGKTRGEVEKILTDALKEQHSVEEWKNLYKGLMQFTVSNMAIEEFLESEVEMECGEDKLQAMCVHALDRYNAYVSNLTNPDPELSEEDKKIFDEIFDLD